MYKRQGQARLRYGLCMNKPDAPACARNREPILQVLRTHFANRHDVLEIGSGTGQHAVYFACLLYTSRCV